MRVSANVLEDLAPTGKLRAAINQGNAVLAQKGPNGEPVGVTVDLALELAKRLGVALEMTTFDAAGKVFATVDANVWDIAFLAIEPVRAAHVEFTEPYVHIEGTYVVPSDSKVTSLAEIDHAGIRIAVGKGSGYDLFLTRTLRNATLVRADTGHDALNMFLTDKLEAAAGVRQPILDFIAEHSGLRIIEPRFMVIEQAMATPKGRLAGLNYLQAFIEEMKASGFVAEGLERSGRRDATVAPTRPHN